MIRTPVYCPRARLACATGRPFFALPVPPEDRTRRHAEAMLPSKAVLLFLLAAECAAAADADSAVRSVRSFNFRSVRLAVEDLSATFGGRYPNGALWLRRPGRSAIARRWRAAGCYSTARRSGAWRAIRRRSTLTRNCTTSARTPRSTSPMDRTESESRRRSSRRRRWWRSGARRRICMTAGTPPCASHRQPQPAPSHAGADR